MVIVYLNNIYFELNLFNCLAMFDRAKFNKKKTSYIQAVVIIRHDTKRVNKVSEPLKFYLNSSIQVFL